MKALHNFLSKAPLWQIYIFGWLFSGGFMASLFLLIPSTPELDLSWDKCLKVGGFSGLVFGLMLMLMVSMMRKSSEFWTYAEVVEKAIEKANTKEELEVIFENDFQTLRKISQGRPHTQELTKLYHIMKTKHKYVL
jgi:hypothetical protein